MLDPVIQKPGLKETYQLTCLMLDFLFFLRKVHLYIVTEPAGVERLVVHSWYKQSPDSALDLSALGKQLQNTASSSQMPSAVRDMAFESSNKLICNSSLRGLGKSTGEWVSIFRLLFSQCTTAKMQKPAQNSHLSRSWVAPFQTTSCSFSFLFYFLKQSEANASELHILSVFSLVPKIHITLDSVLRPAAAKNGEG